MTKLKPYAALIGVFIFINTLILFLGAIFSKWGSNQWVLLIANLFYFLVFMLVSLMQKNALQNSNPNVFIRSIMSGMMIKMFATVAGVLAYKFLGGIYFNNKTIFMALFMYLIYLAADVYALTKLNNSRK